MNGIVSTLIYSLIGLVLFIIGYFSLSLYFGRYKLNEHMDNGNRAAGIATAGFLIAIAIVVSGAIQ